MLPGEPAGPRDAGWGGVAFGQKGSVSALAVDINVRRHVLTIIVGVFATAFTIYLTFAGSLAEQLDARLASVVA